MLFILFSVLLIALSGYFISWMIGKYLNGKEEIIAYFTGGMRNMGAGAVIAVTYFPPAVALPVILGMLFQQVLASLYGHCSSVHSPCWWKGKGATYQHGSVDLGKEKEGAVEKRQRPECRHGECDNRAFGQPVIFSIDNEYTVEEKIYFPENCRNAC